MSILTIFTHLLTYIHLSSDMSCDPDTERFNCLFNPCDNAYCPNIPDANCLPDYCGGCNARFYVNSVEVTEECCK